MTFLRPELFVWLFVVLAGTGRADSGAVIDLWPEGVPGLKPDAGPEKKDNGRFSNIHHPTLTVYAPLGGRANGTAVIYAAGGGYVRVAIGANGGEITRWLNSLGTTVFVLKYGRAGGEQPLVLPGNAAGRGPD